MKIQDLRIALGTDGRERARVEESRRYLTVTAYLASIHAEPCRWPMMVIEIRPHYSFPITVPAVQRTEQGFHKGKTPFLMECADVITIKQMTDFKRLE